MKGKVALLIAVLSACREERERPDEGTAYADIRALLQRCAPCHAGDEAAAGYRTTSYYELIGCIDGGVATRPSDSRAPLLAALARPDHATLFAAPERALLERWVELGARRERGAVHAAGILDPRSEEWHGKLAGEQQFAPLRAGESDGACGRCHDGTPARPSAVRFAAPNAPSCTSCHDQPGGVLACSTCHGDDTRAHPPRDGCYFDAGGAGAHAAHVESRTFRAEPLPCASCHPVPSPSVFESRHADGNVDVSFALGGAYDAATGVCTAPCHARGGERTNPSWRENLTLDCNGCHLSPPPAHYPGPCSTCHAEMGASASSLRPGPLHLNGLVDVGSGGGGGCAACHGEGSDAWPRDQLHRRHRDSLLASPLRCDECHVVPVDVRTLGHLDGRVDLRFAGRAVAPQAAPRFDAESKTCAGVACHGGALREVVAAPAWLPPASDLGCATCHAVPPPPPHVQQPSCGGALCHGAEVRGAAPAGITESGRTLHLDGIIEAGGL